MRPRPAPPRSAPPLASREPPAMTDHQMGSPRSPRVVRTPAAGGGPGSPPSGSGGIAVPAPLKPGPPPPPPPTAATSPGGHVVGRTGGGGAEAPAPPHHPPTPPPVAFAFATASGLPLRATATRAWAAATAASLEAASWLEPDALPAVVPHAVAMAMLDALGDAVKAQPTVVDVSFGKAERRGGARARVVSKPRSVPPPPINFFHFPPPITFFHFPFFAHPSSPLTPSSTPTPAPGWSSSATPTATSRTSPT